MRSIILTAVLVMPGPVWASPLCNDPNAAALHSDAPSTSVSFSYTLRSGADQTMFIAIQGRSGDPTITNVQYAGVAATLVVAKVLDSPMWSALYRVPNPSAGTNNVTATLSAAPTRVDHLVYVCNDTDVADPIRSSNTGVGPSTTLTTTVGTVDSADTVIDVFVTDDTAATIGADQTAVPNVSGATGSSYGGASYQAGSVSPAEMSWTMALNRGVIHAASVKPAPLTSTGGTPLWFQ